MLTRRAWIGAAAAVARGDGDPPIEAFFRLLNPDGGDARRAAAEIRKAWRDSYAILLIELLRIYTAVGGQTPERVAIRDRVTDLLVRASGKNFGEDAHAWARWAWALDYRPPARYAEFKGKLYSNIDPRMEAFFPEGVRSEIRLDQVEWGGVRVNGIPPLVDPAMVTAAGAGYLKDSNAVFGIERNGDARAYPKRILAWHEMARDTVGGEALAIVYCTLCGTVIPYLAAGHTLGTSGLLYQSSKLMFDEATKSLWPTLEGRPRIGKLAGSGVALEFAPVVTTTWGEWRERYPETKVLSLETGHQRNYGEGVAYRDYFGTDALMFEVARRDRRLKNKDEVLVIRLAGKKPLAIAVKLLARQREFAVTHEGSALTVRTSEAGANRVFDAAGREVPAHRAFWFGWYAQFPDTVLIK